MYSMYLLNNSVHKKKNYFDNTLYNSKYICTEKTKLISINQFH